MIASLYQSGSLALPSFFTRLGSPKPYDAGYGDFDVANLLWAGIWMQEALRAMNQLVADGVIADYAIGGAVGAAFYIQAVQTEDLDVFIALSLPSSGLISLSPIYAALIAQGGVVDREFVRFGMWPVQVLTDANALIREAIARAIALEFRGVPTRVFTAEHLCAIALQTGRTKDFLRVGMFFEEDAVDREALVQLVQRFQLEERLSRIEEQR